MATINLKDRSIRIKIVYYGPGRSGKTTNLEYIYNKIKENDEKQKGKMVSIDTNGDRTMFFDFFPIDLGKINGFDLKLQLYTTPGQVRYEFTRRLVLKGVDGIVFVADSMASRQEANVQSFENLKENLSFHNKTISDVKIVFQWNKRDIDEHLIPLATIEEMEERLNSKYKFMSFPASAETGLNVFKTVNYIAKETVKLVTSQYDLKKE